LGSSGRDNLIPQFIGNTMIDRLFFRLFSVIFTSGLFAATSSIYAQGPGGPAPVEVATAVMEDVAGKIEVTGSAVPWRTSLVTAQTSGKVLERKVRLGQEVNEGDVMFQLDTKPLELELAVLEAGAKDLEVRYDEAAARSDRSKSLYDDKHISQEHYQADLTAEASLGHQLSRAKASVDELKDRIERQTVRAPFDGVIVSLAAEVGGWVDPGEPIVRILDLSYVKVVLMVPEKWIASLDRDAEVSLKADAVPGMSIEGALHAVVPEADADSRTIPVIIKVPNPERKLHAGMFFSALLTTTVRQQALLVHKDALSKAGAAWQLFVVLDGKAIPMMVKRHEEYGSNVRIEGDVQPGMPVVVRGNERLRPGMPVRIKGDEASAPPPNEPPSSQPAAEESE
jgi:RND family efflux transporter MFP subunit